MIQVELVYALPERQYMSQFELETGACIRDVIMQSGILEEYAELGLENLSVGIFGKRKTLDTEVMDNDRVEIYRPLQIDPKEARRRRAQLNKNDI